MLNTRFTSRAVWLDALSGFCKKRRNARHPQILATFILCRRCGVYSHPGFSSQGFKVFPTPPRRNYVLLLPYCIAQSKNAPKSAHVYVASAYPEWKQQTLAHLRGCLEANGGEAFAPDVMKGLKVIIDQAFWWCCVCIQGSVWARKLSHFFFFFNAAGFSFLFQSCFTPVSPARARFDTEKVYEVYTHVRCCHGGVVCFSPDPARGYCPTKLTSALTTVLRFLISWFAWKAFSSAAGFDKKRSQAVMQFAAFVKAEFEEAGPQVRVYRSAQIFLPECMFARALACVLFSNFCAEV